MPDNYNSTPPHGMWITEEAILDIHRQYTLAKLAEQTAVEEMERLVRLNDEREKLFQVLKEQFDILFAEVEEKGEKIRKLEQTVEFLMAKLRRLKKKRGRVDTSEEL